jgi:hypothetical protein
MSFNRRDDERPVAMVDESYRVIVGGHYVMAAAVAMPAELEEIRQQILPLPPGRKKYFRWADESDPLREKMLGVVEALCLRHVVVTSTPVHRRRQERARGVCLERLMWELHQLGVGHVLLESRGDQDAEDKRVIGGLRNRKVIPRTVTFDFGTKRDPELWIPDAVAGAVLTLRCEGDSRFASMLTGLKIFELPGIS